MRLEYSGITEQRKAALKRLKDAKILFGNRAWRGSMYLAGYYVECRIKAKLMEKHNARSLMELEERIGEDIATHNVEWLLRLTGRFDRIKNSRTHWLAFNTCNKWKPSWRYHPEDGTESEAEDFLDAVERMGEFVDRSI